MNKALKKELEEIASDKVPEGGEVGRIWIAGAAHNRIRKGMDPALAVTEPMKKKG